VAVLERAIDEFGVVETNVTDGISVHLDSTNYSAKTRGKTASVRPTSARRCAPAVYFDLLLADPWQTNLSDTQSAQWLRAGRPARVDT
jgi:hypothetical protein